MFGMIHQETLDTDLSIKVSLIHDPQEPIRPQARRPQGPGDSQGRIRVCSDRSPQLRQGSPRSRDVLGRDRRTVRNLGAGRTPTIRQVRVMSEIEPDDPRWRCPKCGSTAAGHTVTVRDGFKLVCPEGAEGPVCGEVRPGTLGYQRCVKAKGHSDGIHRSQDMGEWETQIDRSVSPAPRPSEPTGKWPGPDAVRGVQ